MKNLKKVLIHLKNNPLIPLLFLTILLKSMIFDAIVPMWHTPDEQAHFAQTAYFSEFGEMPSKSSDLNREILESEKLLGTLRNERGENRFTYHPEYRIDYTSSLDGKFEGRIINLPISYRKELVRQEAANYPPLYYWITTIPYKLLYQTDLITRVFSARVISIILSLGTIYIGWLISKKLFPGEIIKQTILIMLVAFQPMFSFVSVGVNSDNLLNLLFSILLYICLIIIEKGPSIRVGLTLFLFFGLLYLTKPQAVFGIPILVLAVLFWFVSIKKVKTQIKIITILGFLTLGIGLLYLIQTRMIKDFLYQFPSLSSFDPGVKRGDININFFNFLINSAKSTIAETLPWYWGVFNWLGVVLPRDVNRVVNRVLMLSGLGFIIWLIKRYKNFNKQDIMVIFLLVSSIIYYLSIVYYNYLFTLAHTFSFGIQGRYFFPVIIAHMSVFIIGLLSLIPNRYRKYENRILLIIGILIVILNFVGIWTIAKSYYDLSSINNFITQVSQYKPWYFKGERLINLFIVYGISLTLFLRLLIKSAFKLKVNN